MISSTSGLQRRGVLTGLLSTPFASAIYSEPARAMPDFSKLPPDRRADAEAMYSRMMAALPFEHIEIEGAKAARELGGLRKLGKGWPVAVGGDEQFEAIAEQFSIDDPAVFGALPNQPPLRSTAAILETAAKLRFPQDLSLWPGAYQPEDLQVPIGEWLDQGHSAQGQASDLSVIYDFATQRPFDRVHVLFIPAAHSWEVPAFLRWGGWNACPPPEYHVAALRRWNEAYGAELVGISRDSMDLWVQNPPKDRDQALAVAREIYAYCPDDVDQGTETLAALASSMVMQPMWTFWWD